MDYTDFQTRLASLADDGYRDFVMKGIPSERPFLGVRIPLIREIIQEVPSASFSEFLAHEPVAFEEVIGRAFLVARLPYEEMADVFDSQIAYTDDWCSCDTFCSALRPSIKGHLREFFEQKIETLLTDKNGFATRAGLVLMKNYYISPDYLAVIFDRVEELAAREEYYIRMAIAWLLAECYVKFPEPTEAYLVASKLPKWTFNKAISKICDSRRVEKEAKDYLRSLRKR